MIGFPLVLLAIYLPQRFFVCLPMQYTCHNSSLCAYPCNILATTVLCVPTHAIYLPQQFFVCLPMQYTCHNSSLCAYPCNILATTVLCVPTHAIYLPQRFFVCLPMQYTCHNGSSTVATITSYPGPPFNLIVKCLVCENTSCDVTLVFPWRRLLPP